jgi:hypothetical protein
MAGVVETTHTFANNEVITSTLMNNIIDETLFTSDALVSGNGTLALVAGKLKVATAGITSNEMGTDAVTANAIASGVITNAKISATAAISLSKLASEALPAGITVATANLVDANVTTAKIADAAVTAPKLNGAQTGSAPVFGVRAWAKLNPYVSSIRTGAYKSGNYTRTATETTVTMTDHGLKANDKIRLDFTSGTATDGLYTVTSSANANEFVVNHTGSSTSGNVTAQFVAIQASGNISTASWFDTGDDTIVLNFATQMPNDDYASIVTGQFFPGAWATTTNEYTVGNTQANTVYQAHIYMNQPNRFINVVIIG